MYQDVESPVVLVMNQESSSERDFRLTRNYRLDITKALLSCLMEAQKLIEEHILPKIDNQIY